MLLPAYSGARRDALRTSDKLEQAVSEIRVPESYAKMWPEAAEEE